MCCRDGRATHMRSARRELRPSEELLLFKNYMKLLRSRLKIIPIHDHSEVSVAAASDTLLRAPAMGARCWKRWAIFDGAFAPAAVAGDVLECCEGWRACECLQGSLGGRLKMRVSAMNRRAYLKANGLPQRIGTPIRVHRTRAER
ncbi:unnamed protein product [Gongylonema pulchrum]|uniref:Uncharacterized protein n=1 Tax=Gongylonema pulchrum TaxID=637853 RepID=A0A183DVQ5_9BILA|nr:unnamed protein product [Gongylonema pulchrum]